ncbi:hypothetical protein HZA86_01620 [Candidatus Uhrbacteria bacterium]|nr:hypothetical protein [Candidatus Uhrbacteria bacterium]
MVWYCHLPSMMGGKESSMKVQKQRPNTLVRWMPNPIRILGIAITVSLFYWHCGRPMTRIQRVKKTACQCKGGLECPHAPRQTTDVLRCRKCRRRISPTGILPYYFPVLFGREL